jgi:acetyltransferase-like isoleucine patch superfamily enzyme
MPAESSSSVPVAAKDLPVAKEIAWPGRLLLLALNFIPLAHLAIIIWAGYAGGIVLGLVLLYLVPPLIARVILLSSNFQSPEIEIGSRAFFQWWALFQIQILFCRFPALEEILRLVPGVYSLWLRLWGARIGRLTYWSPGAFISDRSFLSLGHDVVIGAGVRLIPHLIHRDTSGKIRLTLARIEIGDRSIIGGYSILSAGTIVHADQTTRAALLSPPFTVWKNGKRVHHE